MKNLILIILLFLSLSVIAQKDTTSKTSRITASCKLGSFSGSISPNSNVNGRAINPQVSFGTNVRANVGFMILRFDTIGQAIDSAKMIYSRIQLGVSFEQEIGKTNLYVGGAYDVMPNYGGRGIGNMVSMRVGYLIHKTIDLSVQSSKMFGRSPEPSGNLYVFGFGWRF